MIQQEDLKVQALGECQIPSPLSYDPPSAGYKSHFITDHHRIRFQVELNETPTGYEDLTFESAGPREKLFFDPERTTAAIVTCGGLAPGLNNVIRSSVHQLLANYRIQKVLGIRNGYLGLNPDSGLEPMDLTLDFVENIDKLGGTILGSSRGPQDIAVMADFLDARGIDILFTVGGDGTQRGAHALYKEMEKRETRKAIVGIPKTIDNDINYVNISFGYTTALEKASEVIRGAHVEARGVRNGIGLVKLMGRDAGFIAAGASVISQEVDFALIPEITFPLEGENGFLVALERKIQKSNHAVVVVAEGAGQHLFEKGQENRDASGNLRYQDIGIFLREKITEHFKQKEIPIYFRYIDPSYFIRSVPANTYDRYLGDQMGRHAVHAAMAGKTGLMIGFQHSQFIHVPIPLVVASKKHMDINEDLWSSVLKITGQPRW